MGRRSFRSSNIVRMDEQTMRLASRMHCADVEQLALRMEDGGGMALAARLYALLGSDDTRVADNAAWVFSHAGRQGRRFLQEHQQELIDAAMAASGATRQRLLLTILLKQRYEAESLRTDFLDYCLSAITDGQRPVAVRALCVYLAEVLCRPFRELQGELAMTLEVLGGEELKPGLRHARRAVLAAIGNDK